MANKTICALTYGDTHVFTLPYGVCSTAAATAAKTVAVQDGKFSLETGARVAIKFIVTNTATNPTLNVSGTGAKNIMYRGSAISAGYLAANRIYEFVYDGTNWEKIGDVNTNTTSLGSMSGTLPVSKGGTGATAADGARTNLGITTEFLNSAHNHDNGSLNPASIELKGASSHGGYIDFHYGGSSADYTSRIIESSSGIVTLNGSPILTEASTAFNNLKTSVSEGKALIAAAVTNKGVSTAADASFSTIANNINNIETNSINGATITQTVAAGYSINKGDFVISDGNLGTEFKESTKRYSPSGSNHSICWLTGNKYISIGYKSSAPGVIVSLLQISGNSITQLATTTFSQSYLGYGSQCLIRLDDSRCFCISRNSYSSSSYYAILITVSGTTITCTSSRQSNDGYNTSYNAAKYIPSLDRIFTARVISTSDDNPWYESLKCYLWNGNTSTGTKTISLPSRGVLAGICSIYNNSTIYAITVPSGGTSLNIIKMTVTANTITYVNTKTITMNVSGTGTASNSWGGDYGSGINIVDLNDGTFIVFNNRDTNLQYSRVNAESGSVLYQGVISIPYILFNISDYAYNNKTPCCLLCNEDSNSFAIMTFQNGDNFNINISNSYTMAGATEVLNLCEGAYGYIISGNDGNSYILDAVLNIGIRPATIGESCLGIAKTAGSSGSPISVIIPKA